MCSFARYDTPELRQQIFNGIDAPSKKRCNFERRWYLLFDHRLDLRWFLWKAFAFLSVHFESVAIRSAATQKFSRHISHLRKNRTCWREEHWRARTVQLLWQRADRHWRLSTAHRTNDCPTCHTPEWNTDARKIKTKTKTRINWPNARNSRALPWRHMLWELESIIAGVWRKPQCNDLTTTDITKSYKSYAFGKLLQTVSRMKE